MWQTAIYLAQQILPCLACWDQDEELWSPHKVMVGHDNQAPSPWCKQLAVLCWWRATTKVLDSDKKTQHFFLTWQDLEVPESVHKALSLLQEFTDALSDEDYVTVSYVKPVLHLFNSSILAIQDDNTALTLKSPFWTILWWPSHQQPAGQASLVDPRFRTTSQTNRLRKWSVRGGGYSDQGTTVSMPHEAQVCIWSNGGKERKENPWKLL